MRQPVQREAPGVGTHKWQATRLGIERGLAGLARRFAGLTGWRRWLAAVAAGAISIISMAPFFVWPVLLVTLPVLIWLIDGAPRSTPASANPAASERGQPGLGRFDLDRRRLLSAAAAGWWFGYGFHVAGLYWLREAFLVTGGALAMLWPLGVLGLPAFLAVFHGLAAACVAAVKGSAAARVLVLAMAMGASEWLRGNAFTGFPWNVLGLALTGFDSSMQVVALIGIYGLTLVTVLVLAGPAVLLAAASHEPRRLGDLSSRAMRWLAIGLLCVPVPVMHGYGAWRLSTPPPEMVEGVRLRLVQPSIPQREKWQAEKQLEFVQRHLELTRHGPAREADGLVGITHVIWPEAAMPFLPLQRPQVLDAIGAALPDGVYLLAGVLRMERTPAPIGAAAPELQGDVRIFNSLAAFNDAGVPFAVYDKTHLVPFGEYLPFPGFLEGIGLKALTRQRGGFSIGATPRPLLHLPGLPPAGPLICYEAIFPGISRQSRGRPSFLLNVTNDGWFGNSTGPRQHLHQTRMRSLEEGLPLVRVANNGISGVFDAYGRVLARIDLDVAGVVDSGLPGRIDPPLYARIGDLPFILMLFAGIIALLRGAPARAPDDVAGGTMSSKNVD